MAQKNILKELGTEVGKLLAFHYHSNHDKVSQKVLALPTSPLEGLRLLLVENEKYYIKEYRDNKWLSADMNEGDSVYVVTEKKTYRVVNSLLVSIEDIVEKKADLDESGKVLASQLPSYVDDIEEYPTYNDFPLEGEKGKIYIDVKMNKTYRWGGSVYVSLDTPLALGDTANTAYRGDKGKVAYDHSFIVAGNPHKVTKGDIGLGNVDNTTDADKPVSTATTIELNKRLSKEEVGSIDDFLLGVKENFSKASFF